MWRAYRRLIAKSTSEYDPSVPTGNGMACAHIVNENLQTFTGKFTQPFVLMLQVIVHSILVTRLSLFSIATVTVPSLTIGESSLRSMLIPIWIQLLLY